MTNEPTLRTISTRITLLAACALGSVACSSEAHVLGEEQPGETGSRGGTFDDGGSATGGEHHDTGGGNGVGGRTDTGERTGSGGSTGGSGGSISAGGPFVGVGGGPGPGPQPGADGGMVCEPQDDSEFVVRVSLPRCSTGDCLLAQMRTFWACEAADGGPVDEPVPGVTSTHSVGCGRESFKRVWSDGDGGVHVDDAVFDQATGLLVGFVLQWPAGTEDPACGSLGQRYGDPTICAGAVADACHYHHGLREP